MLNLFSQLNVETNKKSSVKAGEYRVTGNKLYAERKFYDALVAYNKSLCYAESNSEDIGLAFANRSAVYCECKVYDKCQSNIKLAKDNKYPEKNFEILNKREARCKNFNSSENNPWDFFKLSYKAHETVPNIADCLELKTDNKFGRYITTSRNLKPGDVLAIEEPFCKIIQHKLFYQKCEYCLKDNLLSLIPCDDCTTTMYCSEKCKQEDVIHHKYECEISEIMKSPILTSTMKIAVRSLFKSLNMFSDSVEDLQAHLKDDKKYTVYSFDFNNMDQVSKDKSLLLVINSMMANEKLDVSEFLYDEVLSSHSKLQVLCQDEAKRDFMKSFLVRQSQIGSLNYHEMYAWPLKEGGIDEDDEAPAILAYRRGMISYGSGSFPFHAIFNHSCAPNIVHICVDGKLVTVAQRPIEKGSQLFDSYGFNFTTDHYEYRQQSLMKQYKFKCICDACSGSYPLIRNMKVADKNCFNYAKKVCRELGSLNLNRSKKMYEENCETLRKYGRNFPCVELCSLIDSTCACLETIIKPHFLFT